MRETPYKHKKNRHCRSPIAREKILKSLLALSIWALPSSGRWGIGSAAHRCWPGAARSISNEHSGTLTPSGAPGEAALLCLGEDMGLEQQQCLGMLRVGSRGGCRSPRGFVCIAPSELGSPEQGQGTATFSGVWQKIQGVESLSLRQISAALWAIISLHFQPPHHKKP